MDPYQEARLTFFVINVVVGIVMLSISFLLLKYTAYKNQEHKDCVENH